MYKLRYSDQVKADLVGIQRYVSSQSGSRKIGLEFTKRLRLKCRKLAGIIGIIGVARPELREGIRGHSFGNYVIFFMYTADSFEVVTIIERHRDIEPLFEKQQD